MNKRIAKKVLSSTQRVRRILLWRDGYGPETGPWPIEKKASAYLDRRQTPYRRTMKIVKALAHWDPELKDYAPLTHEQVDLLVALWDKHRPYIWYTMRGKNLIRGRLIEGETIEYGRKVGAREIADWGERNKSSFPVFVLWTLEYFSDRWCVSRVGRMDAMIDHLRAAR